MGFALFIALDRRGGETHSIKLLLGTGGRPGEGCLGQLSWDGHFTPGDSVDGSISTGHGPQDSDLQKH